MSSGNPGDGGFKPARRRFLQSAGMAAGAGLLPAQQAQAAQSLPTTATTDIELKVNGQLHRLALDPRVTLLDALREHLNLYGSKKGCDRGQCGACTVLKNGRRINACMTLAVMHEGDEITTIEGLGSPEHLHPMQAAFIEHDGFQCGYCTPGQICSAVAMLQEAHEGQASAASADVRSAQVQLNADEIRERMSGNICRCGAYLNIVRAIDSVAKHGGGKA